MPTPAPPVTHDNLFKALVSDQHRAAALLRDHLPPNIAARLSDTPPRLLDSAFIEGTQGDLLFQVALKSGGAAFLYALLEHKSHPDRDTPLQLAGYMVSIWKRYLKDRRGAAKTLPPIIPLVLYHGKAEWTVPLSLAGMVEGDEDLRLFSRDFSYLLLDLAGVPAEELSRDAVLRFGLFVLYRVKHGKPGAAFLRDVAARWPEEIERDKDLTGRILRYILHHSGLTAEKFRQQKDALSSQRGGTQMLTLTEQFFQEGVAEGEAKGRAAGVAEGEAKGRAAGRAAGVAEGRIKSLSRQLERRFGPLSPASRGRLAAATPRELDDWTDRVLDAPTLEDIFGA